MPYPQTQLDETFERLEPNIAMLSTNTAAASIAISLKRIADALDTFNANISYDPYDPEGGSLYDIIKRSAQ